MPKKEKSQVMIVKITRVTLPSAGRQEIKLSAVDITHNKRGEGELTIYVTKNSALSTTLSQHETKELLGATITLKVVPIVLPDTSVFYRSNTACGEIRLPGDTIDTNPDDNKGLPAISVLCQHYNPVSRHCMFHSAPLSDPDICAECDKYLVTTCDTCHYTTYKDNGCEYCARFTPPHTLAISGGRYTQEFKDKTDADTCSWVSINNMHRYISKVYTNETGGKKRTWKQKTWNEGGTKKKLKKLCITLLQTANVHCYKLRRGAASR